MAERSLSFDLVFEADRSDAQLAVDVTRAVTSQIPEPLLAASWRSTAETARKAPGPSLPAKRHEPPSIHCWVPDRELPMWKRMDGRRMEGRGPQKDPVRKWLDTGFVISEDMIEPPRLDDPSGRTEVTFYAYRQPTVDIRQVIPVGAVGHWCVLPALDSINPDIYAAKILWWEAKRVRHQVAGLVAGLEVKHLTTATA